MRRSTYAGARLFGGAALVTIVVWRLGTGPFVAGVRTITAGSLAAAVGIAAVTTVCSAWRWSLVARGLGVQIALRPAIAAYYRSQFLNTAMPAGVLGDVDRALRHGRETGDVGRGLRAVACERFAGQVVQAALALTVLVIVPPPLGVSMPVVAAAVVGSALGIVLVIRAMPGRGSSRGARFLRATIADLRTGPLARRAWPGVVVASVVVVAGHVATFLIAARTAGSTASTALTTSLAMLVLLAMAVPANVGGWGPREGVAAWLFGAAGLGSRLGVTVATVYGVIVIAASLPGAIVIVTARLGHVDRHESWPRRSAARGARWLAIRWPAPHVASREGATGG